MALTPVSRLNDSPLTYDSESSEQRSIRSIMRSFRGRRPFAKGDDGKYQPPIATRGGSRRKSLLDKRFSRRVASTPPGAQHAEKQEVDKSQGPELTSYQSLERRALSADGPRSRTPRNTSPPPMNLARISAPSIRGQLDMSPSIDSSFTSPRLESHNDGSATWSSLVDHSSQTMSHEDYPHELSNVEPGWHSIEEQPDSPAILAELDPSIPNSADPSLNTDHVEGKDDKSPSDEELQEELEKRWILNLSMHFREKTPREKFFVTYAETPNLWRRITVSVDYRSAPVDSLEADLQSLLYQRDKSARIYESIRTSLPDIDFFDTVTNLRLETSPDDRLHVHVTEDVNEIIPYPSSSLLNHINIPRYTEEEVNFESHMSGFVYKVHVDSETLIKKEIPGPDSVEEFLYEINALYNLRGTKNVIEFKGLVINEELGIVKGILISYAPMGPLVDLIFDYAPQLTWERRERWAFEIISGLSEIHEAGYVQGDFTLSNIVIDDEDNAIIIDINRRGCPVGWEPPEIATMIASGQRISMYIGVKSDLFQLGMVLWALAKQIDEPERQERPLPALDEDEDHDIPLYYRDIVSTCLEHDPRKRLSAKELLSRFPKIDAAASAPQQLMANELRASNSGHSQTEYIDPDTAVSLDDIPRHPRVEGSPSHTASASRQFWSSHTAYDSRPSSIGSNNYNRGASCLVPRRGRSPPRNTAHMSTPFHARNTRESPDFAPQIVPVSPSDDRPWAEMLGPDGLSYLARSEDPAGERQALPGPGTNDRRSPYEDISMRRSFTHVDSGLGDMGSLSRENTDFSMSGRRVGRSNTNGLRMEPADSGLADMDDFLGIGENETLKDLRQDDIDEGPLGRRGGELEPVSEHEVLDSFGGELSPQDTIAAFDKVFGGHGGDGVAGMASISSESAGPSAKLESEPQDRTAAPQSMSSSNDRQCKYS